MNLFSIASLAGLPFLLWGWWLILSRPKHDITESFIMAGIAVFASFTLLGLILIWLQIPIKSESVFWGLVSLNGPVWTWAWFSLRRGRNRATR